MKKIGSNPLHDGRRYESPDLTVGIYSWRQLGRRGEPGTRSLNRTMIRVRRPHTLAAECGGACEGVVRVVL